MKKQFKLTQKGIDELKAELIALNEDKPLIADRIKTAREFGDLAENAEYSSAMGEKERNETRVAEIENILQSVEVIKAPAKATNVQLGSTVELKDVKGKTKSFTVVGTVEADPLNGKISDESPIGKALLGKKLGQEVEITTPAETNTYTIAAIA